MCDNVIKGAVFQPHQTAEHTSIVYVALDLEARIERTRVIMLDSCSSRIRGDGEEISITEVKYSG